MKIVIDASVAIKWFLWDIQPEPDAEVARGLLPAIEAGRFQVLQPPHWWAEVIAVIARRNPQFSARAIASLAQVPTELVTSDAIYLRAAELSHRLNHHLFDTLYHAVALKRGATLVTADVRYFAKARMKAQSRPCTVSHRPEFPIPPAMTRHCIDTRDEYHHRRFEPTP